MRKFKITENQWIWNSDIDQDRLLDINDKDTMYERGKYLTEVVDKIPDKVCSDDIIIAKGEHYLISVCDEEAKANYVQQSLRTLYDLTYNLMTLLKSELIATPKYEHLKPDS